MSDPKGNTAVQGDHDRVAMLSVKANGTLDQTPGVEIIGNREFAEAATREQFRQQATSAAHASTDQAKATGDLPPQDVEDPEIAERKKVNEATIDAADKAASATVAELFTKDEPASTPAGSEQSSSTGRRAASTSSTGK